MKCSNLYCFKQATNRQTPIHIAENFSRFNRLHTTRPPSPRSLSLPPPPRPCSTFQGQGISQDQPLFDAGFDSLTAEEFVGRLQERLVSDGWVSGGLREAEGMVSSTTVFDCPTARHIAQHVEGVLSEAGDGNLAAATGPLSAG